MMRERTGRGVKVAHTKWFVRVSVRFGATRPTRRHPTPTTS